jgi:uncharacterized coiled-coil DUF342 family protein
MMMNSVKTVWLIHNTKRAKKKAMKAHGKFLETSKKARELNDKLKAALKDLEVAT